MVAAHGTRPGAASGSGALAATHGRYPLVGRARRGASRSDRRRSCLRSFLCTPLRRYTSWLGAAASVSSSKRRKGRSGMVCRNEPAAKVENGLCLEPIALDWRHRRATVLHVSTPTQPEASPYTAHTPPAHTSQPATHSTLSHMVRRTLTLGQVQLCPWSPQRGAAWTARRQPGGFATPGGGRDAAGHAQ